MNKAIFIIDIWKNHYCDHINNFTNNNIDNINKFIDKCRSKKYLIIHLNNNDKIKSNYNNIYKGKINDRLSMKPPFSSNLCYCNKNIPCYFKLHTPISKEIRKNMFNKIILSKEFSKKSQIKNYTKKLEKENLVINNSSIISNDFHPKLKIKKLI